MVNRRRGLARHVWYQNRRGRSGRRQRNVRLGAGLGRAEARELFGVRLSEAARIGAIQTRAGGGKGRLAGLPVIESVLEVRAYRARLLRVYVGLAR